MRAVERPNYHLGNWLVVSRRPALSLISSHLGLSVSGPSKDILPAYRARNGNAVASRPRGLNFCPPGVLDFSSMNAVAAWIPISSAIAALLGGGLGAMLQGRYGASGWRRETRFQSYTRFMNAAHEFNDRLAEALEVSDKPEFEEKWDKVRQALDRLGNARSLITIAGPQGIVEAADIVGMVAQSIVNDGKHPDVISAMARPGQNGRSYPKRDAWAESLKQFGGACRKVLKTRD